MMLHEDNSELRQRQINTLKIFNDNVITLHEDSEYVAVFTTSNVRMGMRIFLPPNFPSDGPVLTLSHTFSHHWITPYTRDVVGAPGLLNFSRYSDLGRVVQAIVREFVKHSPIIPDVDPLVESDFWKLVPLSGNPAAHPADSEECPVPNLTTLEQQEMKSLVENDDLRYMYLAALPEVIKLEELINNAVDSIKSIMEANRAIGEQLDGLKLRHAKQRKETKEALIKYTILSETYDILSQAYSPVNILKSLETTALQADEKSDRLADDFLQGKLSSSIFLEQFMQIRPRSVKLRACVERLSSQLAKLRESDHHP